MIRAQSKRVTYIEIIGHTDDKWEADYNMELSERRAESVRDYLL
jgi:outer membrane protein OmpA-like peptidoglycan-associated protein